MKIILLPGLDGTGFLFDKLLDHFPCDFDVEVVSYDSLRGLSYKNQASEMAKRYEDVDIFIVSESYSEPVCYELSHMLGSQVKGVIFLASFISRPSKIAVLAQYLPLGLLMPNFLSKKLLYILGFGSVGDRRLIDQVFHSIHKADKRKLKSRLFNIAHLSGKNKIMSFPVIYIRPSRDFLVEIKAVRFLASRCEKFSQLDVNGGHFIAQSNPVACVQIIFNAVNKLKCNTNPWSRM